MIVQKAGINQWPLLFAALISYIIFLHMWKDDVLLAADYVLLMDFSVIFASCNFLNFARNRQCLECKVDGPKKIEAATSEMKMGDWICPE